MREAWRSVNLGCLFKADNRRLGSVADEPPVFSLSKHDGLVLASEYFDARVASADLRQYKVVPPGGWAYRRRTWRCWRVAAEGSPSSLR